jgi:hypothetical protein
LPAAELEDAVEDERDAPKKATDPPKRRGRPPATAATKGTIRPPKPLHFPKRPGFTLPPEKFFKYWTTLPQECQDRAAVYVYRNWPVLNFAQILTPEEQELVRSKKKMLTTNIAKPEKPFDTDDWETEIKNRWGSGNYHFKINDVGVKGYQEFPPKKICQCNVRNIQDADFPPAIDYRTLDMSHPDNASYIAKLRLQGIKLPGDEVEAAIAHEEEEMAQVESISKLTDALIESTKREKVAPQQAAPAPAPDLANKASEKAIEIMGKLIEQTNAIQATKGDPKEYIKDLQSVAQMMQPPTPPPDTAKHADDSALRDMMRMQHESHIASLDAINKRLESSEAWSRSLLEKLLAKPSEPPSSTIDKPKSFIHQIKELAEVKDVLRDLLGGESDDTPWYAAVGLRALDTIAANATNFMHNLAVARSGMGEPVAPPEGEAEATDQPGPARPAQPAGKDAIIFTVLTNLRPPLLEALSTGVPGFDFAAWLITQNGDDRLYNLMAAEGKQGLFNLMQKHPQLWMETRAHAVRLDSFADEFLDKEKVAAAIQLARASNTVIPHVTPTSQPPASGPKPNGPARPIIGADGKPIEHRAPQVNRGATAGE